MDEDRGIDQGTVDVALGREVDDVVEMVFGKQGIDEVAVGDVAFDEGEVLGFFDFQGLQMPGIAEDIKADEMVFRVFGNHEVQEVGADEAGASGHENVHRTPS